MTAQTTPTFAVTLIAEAPGLTLADVYAELLPLALAAGFTDVSLTHLLNGYGNRYTAHAHRPGVATTLAYQAASLPSLLETAREALYGSFPTACLL